MHSSSYQITEGKLKLGIYGKTKSKFTGLKRKFVIRWLKLLMEKF